MRHKNILFICEGNDDENLLAIVLGIYKIDINFQIYKYKTNIHVFAKYLFQNYATKDGVIPIEDIDIIQILKEFRYDEILEKKYTDILLVFDFDPQDPRYRAEILLNLMDVFSDSTNLGQLFINYPMVEASIDFKDLPDPDYNKKICKLEDIRFNGYKNAVKNYSVIRSIKHINEDNLYIILKQTCEKMMFLTGNDAFDYVQLLTIQNKLLLTTHTIAIIATCLLFVREYNTAKFYNYIHGCNRIEP